MRISDWSSDVCSSDLFASATVLEGHADADNRILVGISHWNTTGEVPLMELGRMHIGTGTVARAGTAPVRYVDSVLTDADQHLRFLGGSESDRQQKLFYRANADADWKLVNDQASSGRIIYRSEEHTSELQSLMRISYAVFCLKKKKHK